MNLKKITLCPDHGDIALLYLCTRCGECLPCKHAVQEDKQGWVCQGKEIWIDPYDLSWYYGKFPKE